MCGGLQRAKNRSKLQWNEIAGTGVTEGGPTGTEHPPVFPRGIRGGCSALVSRDGMAPGPACTVPVLRYRGSEYGRASVPGEYAGTAAWTRSGSESRIPRRCSGRRRTRSLKGGMPWKSTCPPVWSGFLHWRADAACSSPRREVSWRRRKLSTACGQRTEPTDDGLEPTSTRLKQHFWWTWCGTCRCGRDRRQDRFLCMLANPHRSRFRGGSQACARWLLGSAANRRERPSATLCHILKPPQRSSLRACHQW